MYVILLVWQCQYVQVIAIHAFLEIYLDIKMSDFEAKKKKNILADLISIHDMMYVSLKMQHQF